MSFAPIIFAKFVDTFGASKSLGFGAFAMLVSFLLVHLLANLGREALWITVGPIQQRIQRRANVEFFQHALSLPFQYHVRKSTGEFQEKLNQAQNGMNQIIFATLTSLLPILLQTFFVLANGLFVLPSIIVVVMLATISIYLIVLFYGTERVRQHQRHAQQFLIKARGFLADALLNIETVKAFVQEEGVARRYDEHLSSAERRFGQFLLARFGLGAAQVTIVMIGLAVSFGYGALQVESGALTIGTLVLIQMYFVQLIEPLQGLSMHYRDIKSGLAMLDGVAEVLMLEQEVDRTLFDGVKATVASNTAVERLSHLNFDRCLSFEAVTVLRDGRAIIDDVSLRIEPGQSIAIVGATGAGKSSLVRLVMKLIEPTSGDIRLGDTSLASVPSTVWRRYVSLVPQEVILLNDTLANNLLFANPHASRQELEEVIRRAKLLDLVNGSKDGLDMVVGERGQVISGGERQRIALARALLRKPKIYVFDEATSALDRKTEDEIWQDLRQLDAAATKIIVTHRLQSIIHCDVIYVLENGRVAQAGGHDALVAEEGCYRSFWSKATLDLNKVHAAGCEGGTGATQPSPG